MKTPALMPGSKVFEVYYNLDNILSGLGFAGFGAGSGLAGGGASGCPGRGTGGFCGPFLHSAFVNRYFGESLGFQSLGRVAGCAASGTGAIQGHWLVFAANGFFHGGCEIWIVFPWNIGRPWNAGLLELLSAQHIDGRGAGIGPGFGKLIVG